MFLFCRFIVLGYLLHTGFSNVMKGAESEIVSEAYDDIKTVDYNDYIDGDYSSSDQVRSTISSKVSTEKPYFDVNERKVYQKLGQFLQLLCPIKNFDGTRQQIMWYKNEYPITNGRQSLNDIYKVDLNFNLIIEQPNKETLGNYYCMVMPQNVKLHISVQEESKNNENLTSVIIDLDKNVKNISMEQNMSYQIVFGIVLFGTIFCFG